MGMSQHRGFPKLFLFELKNKVSGIPTLSHSQMHLIPLAQIQGLYTHAYIEWIIPVILKFPCVHYFHRFRSKFKISHTGCIHTFLALAGEPLYWSPWTWPIASRGAGQGRTTQQSFWCNWFQQGTLATTYVNSNNCLERLSGSQPWPKWTYDQPVNS